jgi:hypothetical protein
MTDNVPLRHKPNPIHQVSKIWYHSTDLMKATQDVPQSTPTFPLLPTGLSAFLRPKSAELTHSRTLAHIAGMFTI